MAIVAKTNPLYNLNMIFFCHYKFTKRKEKNWCIKKKTNTTKCLKWWFLKHQIFMKLTHFTFLWIFFLNSIFFGLDFKELLFKIRNQHTFGSLGSQK
jgi:hypothetical protein